MYWKDFMISKKKLKLLITNSSFKLYIYIKTVLSFSLKNRKNTDSKNRKAVATKNGITMCSV